MSSAARSSRAAAFMVQLHCSAPNRTAFIEPGAPPPPRAVPALFPAHPPGRQWAATAVWAEWGSAVPTAAAEGRGGAGGVQLRVPPPRTAVAARPTPSGAAQTELRGGGAAAAKAFARRPQSAECGGRKVQSAAARRGGQRKERRAVIAGSAYCGRKLLLCCSASRMERRGCTALIAPSHGRSTATHSPTAHSPTAEHSVTQPHCRAQRHSAPLPHSVTQPHCHRAQCHTAPLPHSVTQPHRCRAQCHTAPLLSTVSHSPTAAQRVRLSVTARPAAPLLRPAMPAVGRYEPLLYFQRFSQHFSRAL